MDARRPAADPRQTADQRVRLSRASTRPSSLRRERLRPPASTSSATPAPAATTPSRCSRAALDGGVDIVQLREKELDRRDDRARRRDLPPPLPTPTARSSSSTTTPSWPRACGADGVHVGQDDMPVAEARAALGPDAIIGLSTHSEEQIDAARAAADADYISVGPIWETPTKAGRPAAGLDLIRHAAEHAAPPFFAIGGIDPANAARGGRGRAPRRLCVVRAIRDAADPSAAARELRARFAAIGEASSRWLAASASARARKRKQRATAAPTEPAAPSGWRAATPRPRQRNQAPRGARAARRGRAADRRHRRRRPLGADRRSRSWSASRRRRGRRATAPSSSQARSPPPCSCRRDGLGDVEGPLLGGARLPDAARLRPLRRRLRASAPKPAPRPRSSATPRCCSSSPERSSASWSRRWRGSRCRHDARSALG